MSFLKRASFLVVFCFLVITIFLPWQGFAQQSLENKELDKTIHVLNRLAFGPRPGDIEMVSKMEVEHYIRSQLYPERIPYPASLVSRLRSYKTLNLSPLILFRDYGPNRELKKQLKKTNDDSERKKLQQQLKEYKKKTRKVYTEAAQARLARAIESPRQLEERMVEFWFNHFNVYSGKGLDSIWIGAYEEQAIRPYVFGNFRDMLRATSQHPAMLFYLDNWLNTAPKSKGAKGRFKGLNENYARELLELHTLGVDGGYTQRDVMELARILTGWGIVQRGQIKKGVPLSSSGFYFDEKRHDYGDKVLLGKTIRGTGMGEMEQVFLLLSTHPSTAKHISTKLARYFVSDDPPPALVERMSLTYLRTNGNIRSVLNTLFHSPEFWAKENRDIKFKDPYRFVVSSARAAGLEDENYAYLVGILKQQGMPLYGCETPNGYKHQESAWLNPDAMMKRVQFATYFVTKNKQLEAIDIADTLGHPFSEETASVLNEAPLKLQNQLLFACPEFMRY